MLDLNDLKPGLALVGLEPTLVANIAAFGESSNYQVAARKWEAIFVLIKGQRRRRMPARGR